MLGYFRGTSLACLVDVDVDAIRSIFLLCGVRRGVESVSPLTSSLGVLVVVLVAMQECLV